MKVEIDLRDMDRLTAQLSNAAKISYVKQLRMAGATITSRAGKYPPEPPHDPLRWYQRQRGQQWLRADGSIGERLTSERLNEQWYSKIEEAGIRFGNDASYAGFVHGDRQNQLHRRTGWKKLIDVTNDELPALLKMITDRITRTITGDT